MRGDADGRHGMDRRGAGGCGPGAAGHEHASGNRERRAGPLETALARSRATEAREAREAAANAPDPDERAANLVAAGYSPGLLNELSQRLGDTVAELEAEREKIERGARRQEIAGREHAAGRADVWQMQRMLDGDFGDQAVVERLERRADGIRRQIAEAQEMIAPPQQRETDPLEAASRHAHQVFAELTRQRFAEAQAGRPEPRPFASVSRGAGRSTEHTGPDCWVCAAARERDAARALADAAAVYGEIAR
jgi:hypothetical protein